MPVLTSTHKLQIVLGGAVSTNELQCVASWRDITIGPTYTPGSSTVLTNGATPVDWVTSPAASTQRVLANLAVYNNDTDPQTVTIMVDVSGTDYILVVRTLPAGSTLEYSQDSGWGVFPEPSSGSLADGDYGDIVVSGTGTTLTIDANAVTDTKLRDSTGLSVIGRSANSSGDPADIVAGSDGDVLRRSGTSVGFGAIPQGSVTNLTSDLAAKAPLASPVLTGVPEAPTASGGTNTTQIATTAFVQAAVAGAVTGLLEFQGNIDCSTNPNYPAASEGDTYYVSVAGKIGGGSGINVAVGDAVVAKADNAGGTQAAVGTDWFILEKNLDGALLSANNLSDVGNAATAASNLGLGTASNPEFASVNIGHASDTTITRVSAGVIAVEGATILVNGGALGTPSGGTLTNCSGLPLSGVVDSTSEALGVGSIELGHASDTTITRTGAGAIAVEGVAVLLSGGALGTPSGGTLTNCTGLPLAGVVDSTSEALGVGSVEIGHASDTTLARVRAGVASIEGLIVGRQSKSISIPDPTNAEDITLFRANENWTITKIVAVLIGSSTPSVTWTIRKGSDRSAAGTEVVTSGTTTTSTTTGSVVTSFDSATIATDDFVFLETTAKSGVVDELHVTIFMEPT